MGNSSEDSSVWSAKANIHLLEMQYHHSRGRYSLAAAAGAKCEKYLEASSDPKTALAIKALRASTLAMRSDKEDGNIEAARRLFEDAIFLAQSMKSEDSREKRKEGKVWEDKCHAWLLHLADVEARRRASGADSAFQSKETSRENKKRATQETIPASARGESGIMAMLDREISMSAPHTLIHGPVLSTPTTPAIPGWLS